MVKQHQSNLRGKVVIAGAGPGDPELLTMKAFRYLKEADVIVIDRLVSEELLRFVKKDAVVIFVGKQGRNYKSVSQDDINEILVEESKNHRLILRLKGGDVSIFSNLLDELETLVTYDIPYEIIPGITAACGAAAYAGIPLTARGYTKAVRFLTCYKDDLISGTEWADLARTDDTLVFYMSSGTLGGIVDKLLQNKIPRDKFLAIVEQATTPEQKVRVFRLDEYQAAPVTFMTTPCLIIVGKVACLHEQFKWLPNASGRDYFRPLSNPEKTFVSNLAI